MRAFVKRLTAKHEKLSFLRGRLHGLRLPPRIAELSYDYNVVAASLPRRRHDATHFKERTF